LGLEVAVDNPAFVNGLKSVAELRENLDGSGRRELPFLFQTIGQTPALHELHRVSNEISVAKEFLTAQNVGMVDAAREPKLAIELRAHRVVCARTGREYLDGGSTISAAGIPDEIHTSS